MAEVTESASGEAGVGSHKMHFMEHADSAIIALIIIGVFVYAFGAVGRYAGRRAGWHGVSSFFGG